MFSGAELCPERILTFLDSTELERMDVAHTQEQKSKLLSRGFSWALSNAFLEVLDAVI